MIDLVDRGEPVAPYLAKCLHRDVKSDLAPILESRAVDAGVIDRIARSAAIRSR
jgi:hypothetical protein